MAMATSAAVSKTIPQLVRTEKWRLAGRGFRLAGCRMGAQTRRHFLWTPWIGGRDVDLLATP